MNNHVKMFTKIFKIGATHGERNIERIRVGFTTGANSVQIFWLMPKHHKVVKEGVQMALRPVVSISRISRIMTIVVRALGDKSYI